LSNSNIAQEASPRSSAIPSSHIDLNPFDSHSPNGLSQWSSSTVGRSAIGKSGKVIEKLGSDLDSAHRERDLYKLRNEELERRLELMKSQMEDLTERKNRAEQELAINEAAISRKGRKIGDLQADLDEEIMRRTRAETESKTAITERDEVSTTCDRDVAMAQERAAFSEMSYDLVLKEREKDKAKFQDQITKLQEDVKLYFNNLAEAQQKLRKLNTIAEQKDAEFSKMDKGFCDVMESYGKHIDDRDNDYNAFAGAVRERIQKMDDGLEELHEAKDRMQWVINVKENVELGKDGTSNNTGSIGVDVPRAMRERPKKRTEAAR